MNQQQQMSANTESAWNRFVLICMPEQSGKTFMMIKKINENLLDEEEREKRVVNFIFCDNSLLLTKQTGNRVVNEVNKVPGTEENYIEFSSRKDGVAKKTADAVYGKIMDGVTNIICCTNGKRVSDISELINRINRSPFARMFVVKIWIDEADKYNNHIKKTFLPLLEENKNVQCFCLTATPETLFNNFQYMNVLPIEDTTQPSYHGWLDNIIEIRPNDYGSTEAFATQVVNEVMSKNDGILKPGTKWYIPAERKKMSHEMMRDLLKAKGFAVFIVNGNGIEMSLPDGTCILKDKTKELQQEVRELYRDYNLSRFAVAITGNMCVGRGISIIQKEENDLCEFIFDYAILSNYTKKAEASQNAGRLKGNYKHWSGYKPPTVFTTKEFNKVASEWEKRSRELGKLAFSRDTIEPSKITKKEFTGITKTEHEFDYRVFDTDEEAIQWVKKVFSGKRMFTNKSGKAPAEVLDNAGNNPTLEYLLNRKWGLRSNKEWIRKIPMDNGKFCVYWIKCEKFYELYREPEPVVFEC